MELYRAGSLSVIGEGWEVATEKTYRSMIESHNHEAQVPRLRSRWVAEAEGRAEPGRYLEMGAGDFALFAYFRSRGWDCSAIEPGSWSRDYGSVFSSIQEVPRARKFDVVVLHDVLEHVADPLKTILHVKELMSPDGRLYMAFPNSESLRARLGKSKWRMVRPLGHLHYFSSGPIKILLEKGGLGLSKLDTYDYLGGPEGSIAKDLCLAVTRLRPRALASTGLTLLAEALDRGDQWRVSAGKRPSRKPGTPLRSR